MPYIEEPYSPQKLENLLQYLQASKEQGSPEDFEIFVDAFKVVKRTNDLTRFEGYTNYIQPDTKTISVLIYDGASPRNTKHVFRLKEDKQTLSGLEVDTRIDDRIKAEKEKWNNDLLRKEYAELKKELEENETYITQLERDLAISQNRKPDTTFVEAAGVVLEGLVRRNPQIVSQLPGGDALAGIIVKDNEEKQKLLDAPPETETKVSFKIKEEETAKEELSEEDKASLAFIKQLNTTFDREQLTKVFLLLDVLAKNPDDIDKTVQFLSDLHKA